jgi:hypothetical protein
VGANKPYKNGSSLEKYPGNKSAMVARNVENKKSVAHGIN